MNHIPPSATTRRHALHLMSASVAALAASAAARQPQSDPPTKTPSPPATGPAPRPGLITRPIPSTSEKLPAIGLGTWQTFDVDSTPDKLAPLTEVITAFTELGGTVVDSSPMYGKSESVAGSIIADLAARPRLFIATKVWTTGRDAGIEQMEQSEQKLRARPLDLIQVHNLVDVDTHLATLNEWKKEGRVRYIGITHYNAANHDNVARVLKANTVDFLQINYSVGERESENHLLPLARDRGVAVIANRPFVAGNLLRRLLATPLPDWAAEIDCTSWAQLLLKFVIAHPAITCAIPATSKVTHLRDNMKACYGRLPDEPLRARIAEAAK